MGKPNIQELDKYACERAIRETERCAITGSSQVIDDASIHIHFGFGSKLDNSELYIPLVCDDFAHEVMEFIQSRLDETNKTRHLKYKVDDFIFHYPYKYHQDHPEDPLPEQPKWYRPTTR